MDDKIFDQIHDVDLKKTMETSYIDYAMSVIAQRALPDVRDGLKPVSYTHLDVYKRQDNGLHKIFLFYIRSENLCFSLMILNISSNILCQKLIIKEEKTTNMWPCLLYTSQWNKNLPAYHLQYSAILNVNFVKLPVKMFYV